MAVAALAACAVAPALVGASVAVTTLARRHDRHIAERGVRARAT